VLNALRQREGWTGELVASKKDSSFFDVQIAASMVTDELGEPICMMASFLDVTDRKTAENALRDSEKMYRLLADNSIDAIWQMDLRLNFTYISPSVYDMTGYTQEEWIGTNLKQHATGKEFFKMGRQALNAIKNYKTFKHVILEANMLNKNGEEVPVEIIGKVLLNEHGMPIGLHGSTRDITKRKEAEQALRQHAERLETLHEIDQAILEARSPEETTRAALGQLRQLVPCQGASVTLFDFEVEEVILFATHISHESDLDEGARIPLAWFRPFEALREGKVHIIEDILTLPQPTPAERTLQDEGLRSHVSVPLIAQSELIGSINLGADAPAAFGDEQIEIVREVANQLAVALQQARLLEQVQRHAKELEQRVAERTSELEAEIAERIQTEEELRLFRYLIDQSHDLVFVIDPETSRFLDVNEMACRTTGYTREELLDIGVTDLEAVIPTHVTWQQRVEQIKKGGARKEGMHKRKDGSTYPVEADSSFVTFGERD